MQPLAFRLRPVSTFARSAVGAVLIASPSLEAQSEPQTSLPLLTLEEVERWSLPDGLRPTFLVAGGSGRIVAGSSRAPTILVGGGSELRPLPLSGGVEPIAAGLAPDCACIEVLDRSERRLVRIALDGTVLDGRRFEVPIELDAGARTSDGWILGGLLESGRYALYLVPHDRARGPKRIRSPGISNWFRAHVGSVGGSALVTSAAYPFEARIVDAAGGVTALSGTRRVVDSLSAAWDEELEATWLSLPLVDVGEGYLQVLGDAASDRRILLLLDPSGTVLRVRVLDTALGFWTSLVSERLLYGARSLGDFELVVYRWRWSDRPNLHQGETR